MNHVEILASELSIRPQQVQAAVELLDAGNTIPFIARYRKEATGSLDDQVLREMAERLEYLRGLEKRREEIEKEVGNLIVQGGKSGYILGSDCSIHNELPEERIRWVVEAARKI